MLPWYRCQCCIHVLPVKIVVFHRHVKLPEGISPLTTRNILIASQIFWLIIVTPKMIDVIYHLSRGLDCTFLSFLGVAINPVKPLPSNMALDNSTNSFDDVPSERFFSDFPGYFMGSSPPIWVNYKDLTVTALTNH